MTIFATIMDKKFYKYCIFLDIDGVLNNELFYEAFSNGLVSREERRDNIDKRCVSLLNNLITSLGGAGDVLVVMSSTWRNKYKDVRELNPLFKKYDAIWEFIEKTPNSYHGVRGVEIHQWLQQNSDKYFGVPYYNFNNYIILDDDSDMMLWQQENFFQVDPYCGLTPTITNKITSKFVGKFVY